MEQLQHDPRAKQLIKNTLYDFLYLPVQNSFKSRLNVLIVRNTLLGGYSHKSFNYKGEHYSCDSGSPPRKWNRLLPQLRPQMDEYLDDIKQLNEQELPFVLGFINQVLNSSDNMQDYLQILPESAQRPLEKLIATCPCKTRRLSDQQIAQLQDKNTASINMMKARLVKNLLI